MRHRWAMVTAALLSCSSAPALAQGQGPLRVGVVTDAMPCSTLSQGKPVGSAVDVWQTIAANRGWTYATVPLANPNAAVLAAANGEVDVAVSCLNIIPERLAKVDFSVPYREDSLAFLSRKKNDGILILLQRISKERVLRDSITLLFIITLFAAGALWLIGKGFNHKDISSDKRPHTFFKGWMMLAMGSGIYKMGPNPAAMSVITLVNICRLVVTSVFVGTTATVVFKASTPADVSQKDSLISALRENIGVDANTVSELWLKQQTLLLKQPELMNRIKPMSSDATLLGALQSGSVGSIMADSTRIRMLSRTIASPGQYQVSAKTFNLTPQSFVFGSGLSTDKRHQINQMISQMRFNGDIEAIVKRWDTL